VTRAEEIRQAEAHDHARAGERGERLRSIANDVVSMLDQNGLVRGDLYAARVLTFGVLADWIYPGRAVDHPIDLGKP
jgi:hypothetical protein